MKKKVNPKVMNTIDACVLDFNSPCLCHISSKLKLLLDLYSVEKREASLKKMLGTVLKDKEKIEQTIEELDRYKRDALKTTWEKVNG